MSSTRGTTDRAIRQINIRVDRRLYEGLEATARDEHRSVPQTAKRLIEAGLRQHVRRRPPDDAPVEEIAMLAGAGGAFDWLAEEPDLYDDTCGEPM